MVVISYLDHCVPLTLLMSAEGGTAHHALTPHTGRLTTADAS